MTKKLFLLLVVVLFSILLPAYAQLSCPSPYHTSSGAYGFVNAPVANANTFPLTYEASLPANTTALTYFNTTYFTGNGQYSTPLTFADILINAIDFRIASPISDVNTGDYPIRLAVYDYYGGLVAETGTQVLSSPGVTNYFSFPTLSTGFLNTLTQPGHAGIFIALTNGGTDPLYGGISGDNSGETIYLVNENYTSGFPTNITVPTAIFNVVNPAQAMDVNAAYFEFLVSINGSFCTALYSSIYSGATNGDPQFIGFRGQSFQVHGVSDAVYNIISSPSLQFNALFTFLSSGHCPKELKRRTQSWSHPGNYLGKIGLIFFNAQTNEEIRVMITSGSIDEGMKVEINSQSLSVSSSPVVLSSFLTVSHSSPFGLQLSTSEWSIFLQNSDHFLNHEVSISGSLATQISKASKSKRDLINLPHGLLGQTWNDKIYANKWKYVEGDVDDYIVKDDNLFSTQFMYNKYQGSQQ